MSEVYVKLRRPTRSSNVKYDFIISKVCGRWKWKLVHQNGTVLAQSAIDYTRESDARRAFYRAADGMMSFIPQTTA